MCGRFGVRVFLLEPDMMLHIPKACIHGFTKLSRSDIAYLLKLMEGWEEWEKIHNGIKGVFAEIERTLKDCHNLAEDPEAKDTVNFGSVALDWCVHHGVFS